MRSHLKPTAPALKRLWRVAIGRATVGLIGALAPTGSSAAPDAAYLYRLHCSGCHGPDGAGSRVGRIRPFSGVIGNFLRVPEGRAYLVLVPGVANAGLSDTDTARVLNFVLKSWAIADAPPDARDFSPDEVSEIRKIRIDDIVTFRLGLIDKLARRGVLIDY